MQLNTINNATSKTPYGNYTAQSTNLVKGSTYQIILKGTYSYATYDEYLRVWIDYNRNNTFEANEIAYQGINIAPAPSSAQNFFKFGNITVPNTAQNGTTRMRVTMKRGAYATACETIPNGEVEDYSILISSTANLQNGSGNLTIGLDANTDIDRVVVSWQLSEPAQTDMVSKIIEHSADGINFAPLADVTATVTPVLHHIDPFEGDNFYRLVVTYADGSINQSGIDMANFRPNSAVLLPNPAQREVTLRLDTYLGKPLQIVATDAMGKPFYSNTLPVVTDTQLQLSIADWPTGLYSFRFVTDSRRPVVKQLVVIK